MSFESMMESLKSQYLSDLDQKIILIRELLQKKQLEEVKSVFHKLKGTGGTYGINEISLLGGTVETLCENHPANVPRAVDLATDLIKQIKEAQLQKKSFDIEHHASYKELLDLAAP
jgi:HPt (histidine-containing phosphotransfer) domain-containing protein